MLCCPLCNQCLLFRRILGIIMILPFLRSGRLVKDSIPSSLNSDAIDDDGPVARGLENHLSQPSK